MCGDDAVAARVGGHRVTHHSACHMDHPRSPRGTSSAQHCVECAAGRSAGKCVHDRGGVECESGSKFIHSLCVCVCVCVTLAV